MKHFVRLNILVFSLLFSTHVFGQSEQKLIAPSGIPGEEFGKAVGMTNKYAIISAEYDDDNGTEAGAAYVFTKVGKDWTSPVKLIPSDGTAGDRFGISVAIDGKYAVVGAQYDDDNGANSGSVYVFKFDGTTWIQHAKLTASDGSADDRFGNKVAIAENYIVVGAYRKNSRTGAAYVFERNNQTWTEVIRLTPNDGQAGDEFGRAVAISDDHIAIGAYLDDNESGTNAGAIYVYSIAQNVWYFDEKLVPANLEDSDELGISVALYDNKLIAGSHYDDDNGTDAGAAYVFERCSGEWHQVTKLVSSDGESQDRFGISVDIFDESIVVGALNEDENGANAGAAYVFKEDDDIWYESTKLLASDGAADDGFGRWVAVNKRFALSGAFKDDSRTGAAYAYDLKTTATSATSTAFSLAPTTLLRAEIPNDFSVTSAYPNPFNPETTVTISIKREQVVTVELYDMTGRRIKTVSQGWLPAGITRFRIDGTDLPSGAYLVHLSGENGKKSIPVTLLK